MSKRMRERKSENDREREIKRKMENNGRNRSDEY